MSLSVAFRVDASNRMGTGHVIRCLTLASCLKKNGAKVVFIMRRHEGNLCDTVKSNDFDVIELPNVLKQNKLGGSHISHESWLGTTSDVDANDFIEATKGSYYDWIIVDHYALDRNWESMVRSKANSIMVIDDLADRQHDCDLLLDQTFGRGSSDYESLVNKSSKILAGSDYALLRPEFSNFRQYSLDRRKSGKVSNIMISMGGIDLPNITCAVLDLLAQEAFPIGSEIQVVMGRNAPWIDQVRDKAAKMPVSTKIQVGIENMAKEMSECDLAIGAGGGTAWERCCMGVPTILIVMAENQRFVAQTLQGAGAAFIIDRIEDLSAKLPDHLKSLRREPTVLNMQKAASLVVDGMGAERVVQVMRNIYESRYPAPDKN